MLSRTDPERGISHITYKSKNYDKDIFHELIHPHNIEKENIPRPPQDFSMDSLPEDMDSLLEPIAFDSLVEDMDSVLEPIAINDSSNVDEFNEIVCRLDSLLEPVVLVERC